MAALPDVTIVIPTHDRLPYLRQAVASALAQAVKPEVIVVRSKGELAAGSVDREFPDIVVLTCAGERAASRNAGLAIATGDWVLFLDDDDLLLPGALETLLAAAHRHRADVVRGARLVFDDDTMPDVVAGVTPVERSVSREDLIIGAEILSPSQTLFRRDELPDDPFREEFVPIEDYALGITMALRDAHVVATSATTTAYRRHPGQTVGFALDRHALAQRRAIIEDLDQQLPQERRMRHRARGYHDLYARARAEHVNGHRGRALAAVLSAAAWSPSLMRRSMWWRTGASAVLRGRPS